MYTLSSLHGRHHGSHLRHAVGKTRVRLETEEADHFTDENTLLNHDKHLRHIRLGDIVTISNRAHSRERKVKGVEDRLEPEILAIHTVEKGIHDSEYESDEKDGG